MITWARRRRGKPRPGSTSDARARLRLIATERPAERSIPSPVTIALLVVANAISLVGVAWWGWDLYAVLVA